MSGWIKLYRKLQEHWVWDNADYLKAWITILFEVNHSEKTLLIHGEVFKCARGESLNSLDTWAKLFGPKWDKSRVRRFFALLKKAQNIDTQSERKTTRLKVLNYAVYQDITTQERHAERHPDDTAPTPNKNEKKIKKKECIIPPTLEMIKIRHQEKNYQWDFEKFFHHHESAGWVLSNGRKMKNWHSAMVTWDRNDKKFNNVIPLTQEDDGYFTEEEARRAGLL